jgi:opacity protein-like surface antigen
MRIRHSLLAATVAAFTLLTASAAGADRGNNWEGTIQLIGTSSESSGGENGSGVDFDSATGFAFGIGYNFNQHLSLGFDGSFVKPKYTAVVVPEDDEPFSVRHKASVFNGAVNGTWNILKGNFTPYLQLGLGWTHVDSNVADGPPVTGCWWDPWWGYVCADFFSTYKDTRFSWNAGLGVRYDFQNRMFLKGSINRIFVDGAQDAADPEFDLWRVELGWRFN